MSAERSDDQYRTIHFEETELRLGLPGGCTSSTNHDGDYTAKNNNGKRGFADTETDGVDLKLNLSTSSVTSDLKVDQAVVAGAGDRKLLKEKIPATSAAAAADPAKPPAK